MFARCLGPGHHVLVAPPAHVLAVFASCSGGASVMFGRCLHHVLVVYWLCFAPSCMFLALPRSCLGSALIRKSND